MTLATRLGGFTLSPPPPPPKVREGSLELPINWTASRQDSSFHLKEGGSQEQVDPKHFRKRGATCRGSAPPLQTVKDWVNHPLARVGQGPGISGEGCSPMPHSLVLAWVRAGPRA